MARLINWANKISPEFQRETLKNISDLLSSSLNALVDQGFDAETVATGIVYGAVDFHRQKMGDAPTAVLLRHLVEQCGDSVDREAERP